MKQQKVDINAVIANLGNGNVTTGNTSVPFKRDDIYLIYL